MGSAVREGGVEIRDGGSGRDRVAAAVVLGLVASVAAASAMFVTEKAGGRDRWWWIVGFVVALPTGLAVLATSRRRRVAVGLAVTLATVAVSVVLERRSPIPEDRVSHRFEEVALPSGYSFASKPYVGDDALGVGGYFVSVSFERPAGEPGEAAEEVCASLRSQGWTMRCRYDLFSTESANQTFLSGDPEYADLWGRDGRFRVAVDFSTTSNEGVLIVKTDQPPLRFPFFGE